MTNVMKRISVLLVLCTVMLSCSQGNARTVIQTNEKPQAPQGYAADATYLYAEKDGEGLYLDIYESTTSTHGQPTIAW